MKKKERATFSLDPDALVFLRTYAEQRGLKLSPALTELILHVAGKDKANPALVQESLDKSKKGQ